MRVEVLQELAGEELIVDEWSPGGDLPPLPRVAPTSSEAAAELVRRAARDGFTLLPVGGGTRLEAGVLPRLPDLAVSTARLRGVTAYEPGDGTLTALAGTPLAELARVAAEGGHHLTPDAAHPERSTLGGVAAAGASGRERLRYGPARHHVLGVRALLADGTLVRSGGSLVKNVTGYDLHRLLVGARGSLGLLVEVSLRLFPAPRRRVVVRATVPDLDAGVRAVREVERAGARPETACVEWSGGTARVVLVLAGREDVVDDELERLRPELPDAEALEGPSAALSAELARLRDGEHPLEPHLVAGSLPTGAAELGAGLLRAARGRLSDPALRLHPSLATAVLSGPGAGPELVAATREELRPLLDRGRATVRLAGAGASAERPARSTGGVEGLVGRLRDALDPTGVFAGAPLGGPW